MHSALTIAGFDPSGGAGIQTDLKVFRKLGIFGFSAAAALTAQNSSGVDSVAAVDTAFLKRQLDVLLLEVRPDATKLGMLYTEENVAAVADVITRYTLKQIVMDPIIISSSGKALAQTGTIKALMEKLLPLCAVVTPNIYEASVLSGIQIENQADMEKAALRINASGARNVIITGGHLDKVAMDLLYDGEFHCLKSRKVDGEYHGTGCAFSAAVAAGLAKGKSVREAAEDAKRFVRKAFKDSFTPGPGMRYFNI